MTTLERCSLRNKINIESDKILKLKLNLIMNLIFLKNKHHKRISKQSKFDYRKNSAFPISKYYQNLKKKKKN